MRFFRHNLIRRLTLLFLLSWGLFTQVTTVYACEADNGKKQVTCCCDMAGKMECEQKGKCNHQNDTDTIGVSTTSAGSCCDILYGVTDASKVSSQNTSSLQILQLDAWQPLPALPSDQSNAQITTILPSVIQVFSPPNTGTLTFLYTQRLRI